MSLFINTGNADFASVRRSEYVDKSMLISYVNSVLGTQDKFMCVTRARRFGKSIAAKMLNAYYDESVDSNDLFIDLKIANDSTYSLHRNKYPVIYLDVSGFTGGLDADNGRIVNDINNALSKDLIDYFPQVSIDPSEPLNVQLLRVVEYTKRPFIMIVDEWDAVMREYDDENIKRQYVNWLRTLFKNSHSNRIFAGVYMTGILPIKQYNTESALNNFEDFSMTNPGCLAGYFGFTNDEVQQLCVKYNMDMAVLQQWYDGYRMGTIKEIYNPYAVMRAVKRHKVASYWTATAAYESLKQYISLNYEGLRDSVIELLAGNEVKVDVDDFANDIHKATNRDGVLTLLIHLGYLAYNDENATVKIPNYEVRREFERTIQDDNWKYIAKILTNSENLLNDTLLCNEGAVAQAIDYVHQDNTSILRYNDENSLACVLSIAYIAAWKDYVLRRELPEGKGFADIILVPRRNVDKPAVLVELKYNKNAVAAIEQIKDKRYAEALLEYVGEVVLVGVNYDKKTKKHLCKIEKVFYNESNNHAVIHSKVTKRHQLILEWIYTHPTTTYSEIANRLGVSRQTIYKDIKVLQETKVITKEGNTKGSSWKINY